MTARRRSHRRAALVAVALLSAIGCGGDAGSAKRAEPPTPMEAHVAAAVRAPSRSGALVTAGVHLTIAGTRTAPPTDAMIRAVLTAAQTFIRDSVRTPTTLATAVAAGRDVPALTQALTLANPIPSYSIRRARFTWISSDPRVTVTNDQCPDHRQHFVAVAGARDAYVCAPVNLAWQPGEATE